MSRAPRIVLRIAGGLVALLVLLSIAGLIIVQTTWFHNMVRDRIIDEVQQASGGRVEIASFQFDWHKLRAEIRDFVLHGNEPASGPPLFRTRLLAVELKIVSVLKHMVDISGLYVDQPQAYLIIYPDGRTNVPEPKIKKKSDKSALETIVDLAIHRFELKDGLAQVNEQKTPFTARGENLRALLSYEMLNPRYTGEIDVAPLDLRLADNPPLHATVKLPITLEKDKVQVANASIETGTSSLIVNAALDHLDAPRGTAQINGRVALAEINHSLGLNLPVDARAASDKNVNLQASVALENNRLNIGAVQLGIGGSELEASGVIDDLSTMKGSLQFNTKLAVGELSRLLRVTGRPEGLVRLGGNVVLAGTSDYRLRANLDARGLAIQQGRMRIHGVNAVSTIEANPKKFLLSGLRIMGLGGSFAGRAELQDMRRYQLEGKLDHFDIRTLAGVASSGTTVPFDGQISGPVHITGDLRNSKSLAANSQLAIAPAREGPPVSGQLNVTYDARRDVLDLGNSYLALANTRVDLSGSLNREIQVHIVSRNLDDILPILAMTGPDAPKKLPVTLNNGSVAFDGVVSGTIDSPHITGHLSATNFVVEDRTFDRLAADVNLSPSSAAVQNASLTRGKLQAQFAATVGLLKWKPEDNLPLTASLTVRDAPIVDLLAVAGQKDVPVTGTLNTTAQINGTVGDPRGTVQIDLAKGTAYEEPFDRLHATINLTTLRVEAPDVQFAAGQARITAKFSFDHPKNDFANGRLSASVNSNTISLAQFRVLRKQRPGLAGNLQLAADGAADLRRSEIRLAALNANISARGVQLEDKQIGDLTATAHTQGSLLNFQLNSDFAKSDIRGSGQARLEGDYPLTAELTFSKVTFSAVQDWLGSGTRKKADFDGFAEGRLTASGPAMKPETMTALLRIEKIEFGPTSNATVPKQMTLSNAEPIVVALEKSVVRVQSAHITGPRTDFQLAGTVNLQQKNTLDLQLKGNSNLAILRNFNPDIFSDGSIVIDAAVRGRADQPLINGRLELKEASFNMADLPNGITKANGLILFNGNSANIERLTGETGGGQISVAGFVAYAGSDLSYRITATAKEVRVRYPEGASTVANADINLTGTSQRSLLAGTVTILRTGFNPHSDFGSILQSSAQPVRTPSATTGPLAGMQFDIKIETAPDISFQTALAQDIQAEANLRLRGTVNNPALLGRIVITQGELTFFGTKYTLNQGTISFYNPLKIEPILNIDLETKVRGIDVILTASGPINKLNLTHRSDPPLQMSEVLALLATGKAPTSDPGLAANQPAQPSQSWQQMGASALLGQAVANPVSGRLQRLFGVSKLKIDPSFSGVENTPQARLTIEQQVSRDVTFTYITNLARTNAQIIRVEWALNKQWSAVAVREENGLFGLDFLYKKRFK